ncbi:retroviral-like aspartic protease family protein [Parasphingopyxis marina]|uniref:Retropepsin-like domain-containing protein n=1 Tax=Parasphingopyxis marina TaxID=2761622 RepID=A0A842HY43_9SPHN|nr:retroviral-like aspartic protease family protein [Parasphingopyxis marina]MBC2777249.1 retropepsin-like domain-containing protein [Parasphingopyxis marina]
MRGTPFFAAALLASASPLAAEVPMAIAASGHATVPVAIDGVGTFDFVLDTGASESALYDPFVAEHDIPVGESEDQLVGQTGAVTVRIAALPRVTMDGHSAEGIMAAILDARPDGVPLPGIIGLDLFGDAVLDFDLPRGRAAILESGTVPEGMEEAESVAAAPTLGELLTIPVHIGDVEALAVIDTGARKTRINWRLGHLIGLDPSTLDAGETIQGATNMPVESLEARIADVRFGDVTLAEAPVLVADLPVFEAFGVADRPAIIFGMDWLEAVRMVIDFPERRVRFAVTGR